MLMLAIACTDPHKLFIAPCISMFLDAIHANANCLPAFALALNVERKTVLSSLDINTCNY